MIHAVYSLFIISIRHHFVKRFFQKNSGESLKAVFEDVYKRQTLTYPGKLSVGGVMDVSIPLHSTVTGRSEVYWK